MIDPLFLKKIMEEFCDENDYPPSQFLKDFDKGYNDYPYYELERISIKKEKTKYKPRKKKGK